jgi:hypothetical protein
MMQPVPSANLSEADPESSEADPESSDQEDTKVVPSNS